MKVKKLIKAYYMALIHKNSELAKKLYAKIIKKSLKHKNTQPIQ